MTLCPCPKPQRLSACHRHPTLPVTGFCASCLRERLAGVHPATRREISSAYQHYNRKSWSDVQAEGAPCLCELPPRKSCDVRFRCSLRELFNIDDERNGDEKLEFEMGSSGFVVRVNEAGGRWLMDDSAEKEIELRTMKEFIDLETRKKKKTGNDFKDIVGSLLESASVLSKKLRKWGLYKRRRSTSATEKKTPSTQNVRRSRETQSQVGDYGLDM